MAEGSPPPMRGKGRSTAFVERSRGITPAYAGKRLDRVFGWRGVRDHPRLCGEKTGDSIADMQAKGSPPPMRGKVHAVAKVVFVYGITPAYAGKSRLDKRCTALV